jgi:hypothetical protein
MNILDDMQNHSGLPPGSAKNIITAETKPARALFSDCNIRRD